MVPGQRLDPKGHGYDGRGAEPPVPPLVMDRPVLNLFVRELLALERLQQFAAALPTRARVSEPALPPRLARPEPLELSAGSALGLDAIVERLALAGYERVERADERGQLAVRGGIVDVFPTTGREPLRIEFWGDEIEAIRAFSPFTQRALHPVERAVVQPAAERRLDLLEGDRLLRDDASSNTPPDLVPPLPGP